MLGDIAKAENIYIVCGYSDMRKSIDGFAAIIKGTFCMDPFSPSLFLFCCTSAWRMVMLRLPFEPNFPNAAHHIVPSTAQAADEARRILRDCGIDDINDAVNGVYLPTEAGHGIATLHKGRHTNAYVGEVTRRLVQANPKTRAQAEAVLNTIRRDLLNGALGL